MYLNGNALSYSFLTSGESSETSSVYDYISLKGKQQCNYLQVYNRTLSDDDLDSINYDDVPMWTEDTAFLAKFDTLNGIHTLEAGNIIGLDGTLKGVNLKRRNNVDTFAVDLGNIDVSKNNYEDLTCSTNKKYTYSIIPYSDIAQGQESNSNYIQTDFYNWSLTYLAKNIVFLFDLNLSTDPIKLNLDTTIQKTYSIYPKVQFGRNNYLSGKINSMLGKIDTLTGKDASIDFVNQLRNCIVSGEQAILKSRKGDCLNVVCTSFSEQYLDDVAQQPCTVSFDWVEVADHPAN